MQKERGESKVTARLHSYGRIVELLAVMENEMKGEEVSFRYVGD